MISTEPVPAFVEPSLADYSAGIWEITGLVKLAVSPDEDCDALVFEYRASTGSDIVLGASDEAGARGSGRSSAEVRIPLEDLRAAEFKSTIFGTRLRLFPRSLAAFDGMPGAGGEGVTLKFKRKHRRDASHLATALQIALSERRLDLLR